MGGVKQVMAAEEPGRTAGAAVAIAEDGELRWPRPQARMPGYIFPAKPRGVECRPGHLQMAPIDKRGCFRTDTLLQRVACIVQAL